MQTWQRLKQNPEGLGRLVAYEYTHLEFFKPVSGKEVNKAKPVTQTQWNLSPGPGKNVETHYLYRRLDEGASPELANNKGKAIVIDFNCNSHPPDNDPYESHAKKYSHILFANGSVLGFDNEDGGLTAVDTSAGEFDKVFQNADNH